jgi:hypothetical protein
MGINIFHGYGFGTAKPSGFVPVAISNPCTDRCSHSAAVLYDCASKSSRDQLAIWGSRKPAENKKKKKEERIDGVNLLTMGQIFTRGQLVTNSHHA